MKTLSIRQPWASLIAFGEKTIEVRSWSTSFRGRLLIHASGRDIIEDGLTLPAGYAIATVEVVEVRPFTAEDLETACLDAMPEGPHFAWVLRDAQEIEPFPVKGKLGLYEIDALPLPLEGSGEEWTHIDAIMRLRDAA